MNFLCFFYLILLKICINLNDNNDLKKICDKEKFFNNFCKKKKIIVSMTSWPKRITNVLHVLKTLINQETKPDLIEINLSIIEFPSKENELPFELKKYLEENKNIEINWEEKNTGVFKKIIPTIKKFYGMDYYLLSIDDDWLYRKDYITMMINYIETYKSDSFCLAGKGIVGSVMIYKSLSFESDFYEKLTDDIINTRISDKYIFYYLRKKGKIIQGFRPKWLDYFIIIPFNPVFPNSHNNETGKYPKNLLKLSNELIKKIKFNNN